MDNTIARRNAKVVGYVDCILLAIPIAVVGGRAIFCASKSTSSDNSTTHSQTKSTPRSSAYTEYVILCFLLVLVVCSVRIYCAIKLINATESEPGTPVQTSRKEVSVWRAVTIDFFIIRIAIFLIKSVNTDLAVLFLIGSFVDGIFLYFVQAFVTELDQAIASDAGVLWQETEESERSGSTNVYTDHWKQGKTVCSRAKARLTCMLPSLHRMLIRLRQ